jgi:hypothetical protein
MKLVMLGAGLVLAILSITPAQTVDLSPVNIDGTQPVPGRFFTLTVSDSQSPGALYALGFDTFRLSPPLKLGGIGEFGLAASPSFFLIKNGVLNAQGKDSLPVFIPGVPALVGLQFFFQAIVFTPSAPQGAFLSNLYQGDISGAGTHTAVPNRLRFPRALHTTTLLQDGRVLIMGGGGGSLTSPVGTRVTEIYYPWTKRFDYTRTPQGAITQLNALRVLHTATALDDGRVLIAGGVDSQGNVMNTAEVFDPATGRFTLVGNMARARATHTATKLPDGRVLIAGGTTAAFVFPNVFGGATNTTEIFDPKTNAFQSGGGPTMGSNRMIHGSVPLRVGGKDYVLMMSGIKGLFLFVLPDYTSSAEVYDVAAGSFTNRMGSVTVSSLRNARVAFGTAVQGNGRVLVVGGAAGTIPAAINAAEEFNPATGAFTSVSSIPSARVFPVTTALPNGTVLVQGGLQGSLTAPTATASAYLFSGGSFSATQSLIASRGGHAGLRLSSGAVLVIGGADNTATPLGTAEFYTP